eukprot:TRINITY_DN10600_c0_g1_i1.p1 TRINITY_DN10600_c0_g1~~TRINITY_DN10600_c0_g1_i1.p1  ORF type:complete len:512 (+),score=50.50 TRINITY_DN10600_c0_g1_i1:85-1620(+)
MSFSWKAVPTEDDASPQTPQTASLQLLLLGFNAAIGGFMFGYDTSSMSGALLQVKRPQSSVECPGLTNHPLTVREQENIVSSVVLGAFLSSLVASYFSDNIGRRKTLLIASSLLFGGSLWMGLSRSLYTMISARLITGLGVGLASHTVPMFISECAPKESRGRLCFMNDLMIVCGQISAACVASFCFHQEIAGSWRYMLGLGALPAGLMFLGFWAQPESPRYLVCIGQEDAARETLAILRGRGSADPELICELVEMVEGVKEECRLKRPSGFYQAYWMNLRVRRALLLGCGLQLLQQWSGINTIMYYGATILERSGPAYDELATTCFTAANQNDVTHTIYFAASQAVGVLASWWYVDRLGRRPLLLASLLGVVLSLTALGFTFHAVDVSKTAVVVFIIAYTITFGIGLSPVPWTVNAEIYPISVRGACISMSTSTNWFNNFLVSQCFLSLSSSLSTYKDDSESHPDGIFWLYASVAAIGMSMISWKFPETNGKALEEMDRLFVDPGEFHAD